MPYYLGLDVSKAKLDYSLINEQGIQQMAGTVANEEEAIATILLTIAGDCPGMDIVCVVESTGCYHYPLVEAAYVVGIPCLVCNPIVTKQQIRATIRGTKTDRGDAFLIARAGWSGSGRLQAPRTLYAHQTLCESLPEVERICDFVQGLQ